MARIYTYEDAHDNTRWVVERSGFKGEDRKEFDTYAAAKAYQDKSLIETLIRKTKELEIVRRVGIFINSDFESSRHYSYGYKVQR